MAAEERLSPDAESVPKRSSESLEESRDDANTEGEQPLQYTASELDAYLSDMSRWTIFEDAEDEAHYFRRRGDVLAHGLIAARREAAHLQEAGLKLQNAYERLQREYREVAADVVYWQALAEARAEELSQKAPLAESKLEPVAASSPESVPLQEPPLEPREALRLAAAEAAQAESDRRLKLAAERLQEQGNAGYPADLQLQRVTIVSPARQTVEGSGAVFARSGNVKHASEACWSPERTPTRRPCSEDGSAPSSPSSSRQSSAVSGSSHSTSAKTAFSTPSKGPRKLGIGSTPKRCPGLGSPSRVLPPSQSSKPSSRDSTPSRSRASSVTESRSASSGLQASARLSTSDLVRLWEKKQQRLKSSTQSLRTEERKEQRWVASPARPSAQQLISRSAGTSEEKRVSELAKVVGLSPEHT
eukprot:TRINITY_DN17464_c0_g1_i2.p1 TRINITY_DN17464_c0_g1~~TRINITY_DN17464_c0_g1_i2.p1  ORF type:complete len:417 (+),score=96.00 TRINITY_DN17464_c0_g1_i2:60-1310(+)